jgi:hypothetical protein
MFTFRHLLLHDTLSCLSQAYGLHDHNTRVVIVHSPPTVPRCMIPTVTTPYAATPDHDSGHYPNGHHYRAVMMQ